MQSSEDTEPVGSKHVMGVGGDDDDDDTDEDDGGFGYDAAARPQSDALCPVASVAAIRFPERQAINRGHGLCAMVGKTAVVALSYVHLCLSCSVVFLFRGNSEQ